MSALGAHIFFLVLLLASSAVFAMLEIQIEGPEGWAKHLPTWRIDNRITRILFDSKPMTGYHFYALLFLFCIGHLPYAVAALSYSWAVELRILAFMCFFWVVEDFFWFLLNPAYGLTKFRAEHIWWHRPAWRWIMPRGYWIGLVAGCILYALSWVL